MKRRCSLTGLLFAFCVIFAVDAVAFQAKKQSKQNDSNALMGIWEAEEEGETIRLIFKTASVLEFEGEESSYTLVPGAIRVTDPYEGALDYKYSVKGDVLVLTFPEGDRLEFRRVKGGSQAASLESRGSNPKSNEHQPSAGGGQNHLLTGKFMSYSSSGSSSGSSSWTTYATFDGQGNFEWSSESAHSTQQYNQQGDNTGWGVASGGSSGNRGSYRVDGNRILVTFPDGSQDEAVVTERFQDGSIGAFKYDGKVYAR
ncbi:MAG: hypothetical protein WEB33_02690 [Bacteroidota bacterium]